MMIVFVTMVCASVAIPLVAIAWACRPRHCPHCHETIQPDPALVRLLTCEPAPRP
jgi:hypothetical protein